MNTTIRTTMTNLAKDMRELFKDGVSELVSKINKGESYIIKDYDYPAR